ncbi:MAG: DUF4349 domain-containing protein [Pyrinomonadaceae bacterium]
MVSTQSESQAGSVAQDSSEKLDARPDIDADRKSEEGTLGRAEERYARASFAQADQSQIVTSTIERKIIRDADLTVEVASPAEGQRRLASIAEAHGGFVVTSESRQQTVGGGATVELVNLHMRVPASRFEAAVSEIRAAGGGRVRAEKITGKDVTEEFIDLEARLRTQRALETQFMEIMKQAKTVEDALSVSSQLAEVRGEIERVEGRHRFLDNQASLSTIRVTLQAPAPLVSAETSGFVHSLREALGEGVDAALLIVLGVVRVAIALVPVALFIALPLYLVWRVLRRRMRRDSPAQPETVMP